MSVTIVATAVGAVLAAGTAVQAVRAARVASQWFSPQRGVSPKPVTGVLANALEIEAATADGPKIRGWRTHSSNGAAVILVHPGPHRMELYHEAEMLARAGYGVLLFDLLGRGESDDPIGDFYGGWCASMKTAVDVVAADPTVDPSRIGGLGYSCGAALVAEAAARDSRLRAIVLACGFSDYDEQLRVSFGRWGVISQWPALWIQHRLLRGHPMALRSRDHLRAVSPRPVLIVGIDHDPVLPPDSARQLFAAARDPKELLMFPGAIHGQLAERWPNEYLPKLQSFFDRTIGAANCATYA